MLYKNQNTDLVKFGDFDRNLFRLGIHGYAANDGAFRLPELQEFYSLSSYIFLLIRVHKACESSLFKKYRSKLDIPLESHLLCA